MNACDKLERFAILQQCSVPLTNVKQEMWNVCFCFWGQRLKMSWIETDKKKERICNVITRTVKQSLKFGRNVPKLLIQKTFWKLRLSFDEACIFHLIQPSHTFHLISLIHPLQKVSVFLLNVLLKWIRIVLWYDAHMCDDFCALLCLKFRYRVRN